MKSYKERLIDNDVLFTEKLEDAIAILQDGSMVDGEIMRGNNYAIRSTDHRILFHATVGYDRHTEGCWKLLIQNEKLVMVTPEFFGTDSWISVKPEEITIEQQEVINQHKIRP